MRKKKVRKVKFTKLEKLLYSGALISLGGLILLKVFFSANISNLKLSIEKSNAEINNQNRLNESLVMQVNELTAFDNVKDIVKDMGLAYNKDNIVTIERWYKWLKIRTNGKLLK